ncbi:MAG TPA: PepSY domain-containing protein [Allosphingosinicella sp.]|nr:PepSY domain-containing protein [Allosphingosinicella sp.]
MVRIRQRLRRWHIWLGWAVGLPFLAWTVSGLVMVARPIEIVRGENLLAEAPALASGLVPRPPAIGPRPVASLRLESRPDGPKWLVRYADGASRLADGRTGRLLPKLAAADAARLVEARYKGPSRIAAVDRIAAEAPPLDFRRKVEAWRVTMADGTRFYLDAATGEILARRTGWWRFYDLMWGIHIMDLKTREDAHNPLLIGFALLSLTTVLLAVLLLPGTLRRRRRR